MHLTQRGAGTEGGSFSILQLSVKCLFLKNIFIFHKDALIWTDGKDMYQPSPFHYSDSILQMT